MRREQKVDDDGDGEFQNAVGFVGMLLSHKIHGAFKGAVERMTGPGTVSAFKEKGVLSVSEFVLAGDNLVSKCPTWSCHREREDSEGDGGEERIPRLDGDSFPQRSPSSSSIFSLQLFSRIFLWLKNQMTIVSCGPEHRMLASLKERSIGNGRITEACNLVVLSSVVLKLVVICNLVSHGSL
ncbi:hypothetical protein YC2023_036511 [Brassica napus]